MSRATAWEDERSVAATAAIFSRGFPPGRTTVARPALLCARLSELIVIMMAAQTHVEENNGSGREIGALHKLYQIATRNYSVVSNW